MKNNNISDFEIEQYILNELPKDRMSEIKKAIGNSSELRIKMDNIKKSNIDILKQYPPAYISGKINEKLASNKKSYNNFFTNLLVPVSGIAIFLTVISFILISNRFNPNNNDIIETTRVKGENSKLFIYKKYKSSIELLNNNSVSKEGDLLQIAYQSNDKFGIIISIDGNGTLTYHMPDKAGRPVLLENAPKTTLPNSYELDSAPNFEIFFIISSKKMFNPEKVIKYLMKNKNDLQNIRFNKIFPDENINKIILLKE